MHEFKLDKRLATLTNANPRKENEGEDKASVDAIDLDMKIKGGADLLPLLMPEAQTELLKTALWDRGSPMIVGLAEVKFEFKFDNHEAVILAGRDRKITLAPCKVKKFAFEVGKKGDPSFLRFQVQGRPTEAEIGKLCHLQQEVIEIQIAPRQKSMDLGDGKSSKAA